MTPIRDLARELKLTGVSVREHCRTRGIAMHRRLPEGARGGQMIAFVTDKDCEAHPGALPRPARQSERADGRRMSNVAKLRPAPAPPELHHLAFAEAFARAHADDRRHWATRGRWMAWSAGEGWREATEPLHDMARAIDRIVPTDERAAWYRVNHLRDALTMASRVAEPPRMGPRGRRARAARRARRRSHDGRGPHANPGRLDHDGDGL